MNVENRTIFEGDNLHILRGIDSETIDLIYLDPPFNSNRTYEAPIGSEAAGAAFKDAWTLSDLDNAWHGELAEYEPALYSAISAAEFSHSKSMKAYLIMMGIRMLEMRRILKTDGQYLSALRSDGKPLPQNDDGCYFWEGKLSGMRLHGSVILETTTQSDMHKSRIYCYIMQDVVRLGIKVWTLK